MKVSNETNGWESRERPWWHKYIDEESRSVAVIRDKGMSVWSLIGKYRLYQGDAERLLSSWRGELTAEELEAALAYYWSKPYAIDEKLEEISGESTGVYGYGRAVDTPLPQKGKPPWQEYIDEESRNIAIVRNKGWSVWSLVRFYRICRGDKDRILSSYLGELTREELEAALAYYWANHDIIDRKLEEISK